jgi:chloramphenicol-sensitive protein RarD
METSRSGALFALGAYGLWGVVPIYWKTLAHVPAAEVVAHRVIWSVFFVAGILAFSRGFGRAATALRSRRTLAFLSASTFVIAINWGLFIWAVQSGRILQASLGYYVNPLVSVALGVVFLGERLSRSQVVAVVLATIGVLILTFAGGAFPWVSLVLAGTFAAYGLLRKLAPVDAIEGLFVETLLVLPIALAVVLFREHAGTGALGRGGFVRGSLLAAAGPITAVPLLFFAAAARRLPLTTLGFFQYVSPTLQFLCAVLLYGEKLTSAHIATFAFIWIGLCIFSLGMASQKTPA